MKKLILIAFLTSVFSSVQSQSYPVDRGNINIHFGSILVYNTFSLGYESPNLFKKFPTHQIRISSRLGSWNSSFIHDNTGVQGALGFTYLAGKKNHFFEHSSELVAHFDSGLKDQGIVFIASTYRLFLGYRYMPQNKHLILRIGTGWYEIMQIGIGFRL